MPDAALRELATALEATGLDTAPRDTVPVLPALRPVVPGGLRPGSAVGLGGSGPASTGQASIGSASLGSALVAGVSVHGGEDGTGGWCGVVGLPGFGVAAAAGMGAAPERLLLVDEPGDRWPDVVAALCEAVDLILLCPPERPGAPAVRRLSALARKHGCVLALTGVFARDWPGTRLRLSVEDLAWDGIAGGHGRLTGRRVQIVAEGRDAPGHGRRARIWLPAADGTVKPDETARPPLELVPGPAVDGQVADGGPSIAGRPMPCRVRVPVEEGIA